jgi:molybdate transport system substrate-binding protein
MVMQSRGSFLTIFVIAAMLISISTVNAAEVKVMASIALKELLLELVPAFEKASGNKVTLIWGGTEGLSKKVLDGEIADVVILARSNIDKLIQDGKLHAGSRTDLVKSSIGIAVRSGLPKPDVSSADAVKKAVLAARSVGYSSGPSGFYMADLFKKMGIADQIKNKVKQPESGVQIGDLMARGEVDLGFQQVSELLHVKGIDFLGPLPGEIQNVTVFAAGLHTAAVASDEAKALLKFLTGPDALPIIKKSGLEPG